MKTESVKSLAASLSAGVAHTYVEGYASNALHQIADTVEESCYGLAYEVEDNGNADHENAKDLEQVRGFVAMIRQQAEDMKAG